jgi:subtilisin
MEAFTSTKSRSGGDLPPVTMHYDFGESNTVVVSATDEEIKMLKADPVVEQVVPDVERYLQHLPDSVKEEHPRQLQQGENIPYGISMVQADQARDQGVTGSGVKVCVVYSGINQTHEDFVTDRLTGLESSSNPWQRDGTGHGTHCSGTIAAARNGRGVVGVAPDAEIYSVRVLSNSRGEIHMSSLVDADFTFPRASKAAEQILYPIYNYINI